jgi:hypothetical protein
MKTAPVCAKCGKTLEKLSERPASAGPLTTSSDAVKNVICVYRCECGVTFSRTERQDKPSRSS